MQEKANFGQSCLLESKAPTRNKPKPADPEKLNILDGFVGSSRICMKDPSMKHAEDLGIPEWMDILT